MKIHPSSFYQTSYPARIANCQVVNEASLNSFFHSSNYHSQLTSPIKKKKLNLDHGESQHQLLSSAEASKTTLRRSRACDAGNLSKYLDSQLSSTVMDYRVKKNMHSRNLPPILQKEPGKNSIDFYEQSNRPAAGSSQPGAFAPRPKA